MRFLWSLFVTVNLAFIGVICLIVTLATGQAVWFLGFLGVLLLMGWLNYGARR